MDVRAGVPAADGGQERAAPRRVRPRRQRHGQPQARNLPFLSLGPTNFLIFLASPWQKRGATAGARRTNGWRWWRRVGVGGSRRCWRVVWSRVGVGPDQVFARCGSSGGGRWQWVAASSLTVRVPLLLSSCGFTHVNMSRTGMGWLQSVAPPFL